MKFTVNRFFLLSLLLVAVARGDEPSSKLSFADKTTVTGTPQSASGKDKSIKLTSPSLEGEVTLKTKELLELSLDGKPPEVESDHYALATITPRYDKSPPLDTIRGRLLHLDEKTVTLETAYAGKLTLNRLMVKALDIYSQSPSFYNGPKGPDGWVTSGSSEIEDSWTFKDRSMTSKGQNGIARKLELPDRSVIKFTAKWKTSPYFRILFLSDDGDTDYPSVSYSMNVQMSYLSLYRTAVRGQRSDLVNESINNLRETQEAVFTIYLDRSKDGTSAIYIGKDRIGTWTGMDDTKDMGDWLHFVPQQNRPMNFSNITISQWDGVLPKSSDDDAANTENEFGDDLQGHKITLANGDVVIGEIKLIENDFVQASTEFGDVRIPLNRMSAIDLADVEMDKEGKPVKDEDGNVISIKEEPRMWGEDIRAWFHEGGSITIRMATIEGGKIKGSSQVFGEAEFDLNAFSRLEFNIWRRQLDPIRYGSGESW
ncbi:MAG: hypothetical protein QNL33_01465 [Akkermansiaceae bacterium]|jgi:hypothetical protein